MDRAQALGLALFVAAWVVLLVGTVGSLWAFGIADIFELLLLLSGSTFGFDLLSKGLKLQSRGKLIVAAVICGVLLLCLAPAVQTLPNGQSPGSTCDITGYTTYTGSITRNK